jgi:hypothetical protein
LTERRSAHKWKPISYLPEDWEQFRAKELEPLCRAWELHRKTLSQDEAAAQFTKRLVREWAVETGVIEGVYTLERGITPTLIERGVEARYIPRDATNLDPELVARIIQAHADVLEGLFSFVKSERTLTTSYIKELHAALLRHQDTVLVFDQWGKPCQTELRKGAYKVLPNNPSRQDGDFHEYCPPEHMRTHPPRPALDLISGWSLASSGALGYGVAH